MSAPERRGAGRRGVAAALMATHVCEGSGELGEAARGAQVRDYFYDGVVA